MVILFNNNILSDNGVRLQDHAYASSEAGSIYQTLHFRGLIFLESETYGLEPVPQSPTNDHLLYRLKDVQTGPVSCGVVNEASSTQTHESFEPGRSLTSLLRVSKLALFARHVSFGDRFLN